MGKVHALLSVKSRLLEWVQNYPIFLVIEKKVQKKTDRAGIKMLAVVLPGVRFAGNCYNFLFLYICCF